MPDASNPYGPRKWLLLTAGIVVGLLLLWLAVKDTRIAEVGRVLRQTDIRYALPFLAVLLGWFWLKAVRWGHLLNTAGAGTTFDRFSAVLIGYTGNLVLPAQLGELVRVYVLSKQTRTPAMPVLTSIALERVFDLLVMLLLLVGAMFLSDRQIPWMDALAWSLSAVIAAGTALLWLYLNYTPQLLTLLRKATGVLPNRWRAKLLHWAEQGASGVGILRQPAALLKVFAGSVLMWVAMAVCVHLALRAAGIDLPFTAAVFTLAIIIGGMMLPASPGFVGTIQFCFVLVLSQYGVADERALAASVFYHLLITVPILLLGYGLILRLGYNARQLRRGAGQVHSGDAD